MTKLGHLKTLIVAMVVIAATSCSQKQPSVSQQNANSQPAAKIAAEQIAKTYGLDSFGQVDAIRYTWNAQFPGVNVSRAWVWEPKTNQVSFEGKDKDGKPVKVTYLRSQLDTQPANVKTEVDPAFVNDNYWLLLPLHVYWDTSPELQYKATQQLPQGNGSADLLVVKYPSEGGYTPG